MNSPHGPQYDGTASRRPLQTYATQMAPDRRGAAVSLFALSYFVGQTAGVALAGAAATWLGTRGVILVGALLVLAVAQLFGHARQHRLGMAY